MLRIVPSKSADGAKRYHDEALARGDYYIEGSDLAGLWGGHAAVILGLEGEVGREAFHGLCDNINPATGERLTARTDSNRRIGYDFNFHCPKTVSAVYALTEDTRILEAFRHSVRETMRELEENTECRVRDKGQNDSRQTGNMLWSEFVHFTSRPVDGVPDPHLHAHCFAFNATWDQAQEMWKAADFFVAKRDARYFEAAFHARLAGRLAALGYPVVRDGKGYWDIAGIPASVKEKFSRRTAEIDALASELGITDADRKSELGAKSRRAKREGETRESLRHMWDSWLTDKEREAIQRAAGSADGTPRIPAIDEAGSLGHAIEHVYERKSAVSDRQLAETALRHGVGAATVDGVWNHVEELQHHGELLSGDLKRRTMVTTRQVLEEEREMLAFAMEGKGRYAPLGRPDYQFSDPIFKDPANDTGEQKTAIRKVLGSHDRVTMVRGGAGTGKTTLMREVVRGLEQTERKVFAFAPTAEASRGVLRTAGFGQAETVARLLIDREFQQQVQGQVLWIDEAGLLGARNLNQLFKIADEQDCRLILTGDTRQHAPVERGDAMRILEEHGGIAPITIDKIQRQRVHKGPEPERIAHYRSAVKALSEGDPVRGFDQLEQMEAVVEFDLDVGFEERCRRIAEDYLGALEGRNLKGKQNRVLAVSPTHAEGEAVTAYIREGMKNAGRVSGDEHSLTRLVNLGWTEAEKRDSARYQPHQVVQMQQNVAGCFRRGNRYSVMEADKELVRVRGEDGVVRSLPLEHASRFSVFETRALPLAVGDRIRITQNGFTADRHRLNNGALYEVAGFTRTGDIRLNNGWVIDRGYGHVNHGYVTTSHASQGKSVDVVLIAQSSQSFSMSNLEQFYVSVSRGEESVRIYTDDREGLKDAIQHTAQRVSASDVSRHPAPARDRRRERRYGEVLARRERSRSRAMHRQPRRVKERMHDERDLDR